MYSLSLLINYIFSFNLITSMFYCYSFLVITVSFSVNFNFSYLFINDLRKFGKLSSEGSSAFSRVSRYIEIPKRWFLHFYFTSAFLSMASWLLMWHVNVKENISPQFIDSLLNFLTTSERQTSVNLHISYLALLLYSVHVWKRLYENLFISVFSDSNMNVIHYIIGHTHYIAAFIGLISSFPGFSSSSDSYEETVQYFSAFSWWHFIIVIFTVSASFLQYQSLTILANLRKKRNIKSKNKYFAPYGGLFAFVSCPHFLTEILVYFGIAALMSFKHWTWNAVCIFVFCNQIDVALMSHKWYKQQFKDYPLNRKAIFPLLL